MCGICGTVSNSGAQGRLLAALDRMVHRGPDQQGDLQRAAVRLGHRRLAIIDLSEQGRQPICNEDGSLWLVFNGEIYNFAELRSQLLAHHDFRSQTDSEVLIHGYEQWGIDGLLQRVRGMFAFALWDEPQATLHLVRDHVGKKPLYYSQLGGGITFASTLPALLELLEPTPTVSSAAVLDYLTYLCVPAPRTIFDGVAKLPPAHRLEFRPGCSPQLIAYWQPDFSQPQAGSEAEWLEQIEAQLKQAVCDRLVADVPVGAFLSGGVDSSLIVALMAQLSPQPVKTISVGFSEASFNELPYARQVAQLYGCNHSEQILHPDTASTLPELVFHYGEPFADHSALPTYHLAQAARRRFKVVLTGDGGDETFGGYRHLPAVAAAQRLQRLPAPLKATLAQALRALERQGVNGIRKFRWVAEMAQGRQGTYVFDPVGGRTCRFYPAELLGPQLQPTASRYDSDALYAQLWQQLDNTSWVNRAQQIDFLTLLPDMLLPKVDVATMAHSLEARSPFLDLRVVELSSQIPIDLKLQGWQSKYLLKRLAAKYLPQELLQRRKQGFSLPTSQWLRGELSDLLEATLLSKAAQQRGFFTPTAVAELIAEHRQGQADHGQPLWSLLMLELWFQMFVDRTLPLPAPNADLTRRPNFDQVLV